MESKKKMIKHYLNRFICYLFGHTVVQEPSGASRYCTRCHQEQAFIFNISYPDSPDGLPPPNECTLAYMAGRVAAQKADCTRVPPYHDEKTFITGKQWVDISEALNTAWLQGFDGKAYDEKSLGYPT